MGERNLSENGPLRLTPHPSPLPRGEREDLFSPPPYRERRNLTARSPFGERVDLVSPSPCGRREDLVSSSPFRERVGVRGLAKVFSLIFLTSVLSPLTWAEELPPMPEGPLVLTTITGEELSPDYWIDRLPNPDQPLKAPEELKQFNEDIHAALPERFNIFEMEPSRTGRAIREQIELEYNTLKGRILFGVDGERIPPALFENEIKPVLNLGAIPDRIQIRWGAAAKATSVRALPSDIKMLEEIGDIEFDQLQFTLIKLWTPVAVTHRSSDGRWLYVEAPYARGWVQAKDIAIFKTRDRLKKYVKSERPLVVTGESIPIFVDAALTAPNQKASMGTVLPLAGEGPAAYVIWMPIRGEGGGVVLGRAYVDLKSDVSRGFLLFTQRNVIRQAFKLLGARYGWGGMYDGRDCSGFTQDIFLPFGIDMPRTSKEQMFVGTQINHFRPMRDPEGKIAAIRAGTPGVTLLRMPLHQMIYLGERNGQFYVIHSTWAERISMTSDEKRRINQVVVSDLTLNGNSYLGSLFDRIISVSEVN